VYRLGEAIMRPNLGFALLALAFGFGSTAFCQGSCTGLCLQQVSCTGNASTTITGTVYAPNGKQPLPNVLVFVPNATPAPFTDGVSCPAAGAPPSGSPLVGTTTAVDGTFTLTNVPVGTNIPLVIQSGSWRRQLVVPNVAACVNTPFSAQMPSDQTQGDIPKIAIATGNADQVECVLRKIGVADSEFTDPRGSGRINLYQGEDEAGSQIDATTPAESTLMGTSSVTNSYDVIMLPCQGKPAQLGKTKDELQNFVNFANAGGRVYASHYSWDYMFNNPNLPSVANWQVTQPALPDGYATVNINFAQGETLAQWLQLVGATTTEGQMFISTLRHDFDGVVAPTQSWLTLNDAANNNPVMQFVYDAPVGAANQCGRVLFNEYHVENPVKPPAGVKFPCECQACDANNNPIGPVPDMSAQEKLLEYMLFELTNDGGQPTLSPTSADFGSESRGFATAAQTFTWTNHSTFPASATTEITTGFNVVSNNCQQVQGGGSCSISVNFQPSTLGAQTGILTVNSSGPSITAALTGIGIPDLTFTSSALQFGNHDVGSSTTQTLSITNAASGAVPVPAITTTGDYAATTTCGSTLGVGASCSISIIFMPRVTGDRPGTLTVGVNAPTVLDGNGVDFSFALSPTSGKVEAGLSVGGQATASPIAGYNAAITVLCTTSAPAATCGVASGYLTLSTPVTTAFSVSTVSEYTVIGYGGLGGGGWLWLAGTGTGLLLLLQRRKASRKDWRKEWRKLQGLFTAILLAVVTAAAGLTGCSGKIPAKHANYTPSGSYTVTLTATDGFLTHSATYALDVTAP
jgi:hypothetical protein